MCASERERRKPNRRREGGDKRIFRMAGVRGARPRARTAEQRRRDSCPSYAEVAIASPRLVVRYPYDGFCCIFLMFIIFFAI